MKKLFTILLTIICFTSLQAREADAVYNKLSEEYTINADGRSTYRCAKELKIQSHYAFNRAFGETFIEYNPKYQSVEINSAYVKMADGKIVEAPSNSITTMLPDYAAKAPWYNELTTIVVTHTALEIGAKIFLDYTITTKPGFMAVETFFKQMDEECPIKDYSFKFTSPAKTVYIKQSINKRKKAQFRDNSASFKFRNITQAYPEKYVSTTSIPFVFATIENDPGKRVWNMMKPVLEASQGQKIDVKNPLDYIKTNVDYAPIPLYIASDVRSAKDVKASAYGTAAEKAALLLNTMDGKGILKVAFKKGYPECLQTIISIGVELDGKTTWFPHLDPRAEGNLFNVWTISDEDAKETTKAAEVVNIDFEKEINADELPSSESYTTYSLPSSQKGVEKWGLKTLNSNRRSNMTLPYAVNQKCSYVVTLGDHQSMTKPFNKSISNSIGSVEFSLEKQGDKLIYNRNIKINDNEVSRSKYSDFKSLMDLWNCTKYKTIIIK